MASKKRKRISAANGKRNGRGKRSGSAPYPVCVLVLILLAVLFSIFIYTTSEGVLASVIKQSFFALFSVSAYLIPPVLLGTGIYISKVKSTEKVWIKLILSLVGCALISALYQMISCGGYVDYGALIAYGTDAGGIFGGVIANISDKLIGNAATIVVLLFLLIADLSLIIKLPIFTLAGAFISGLFRIRNEIDEIDYDGAYENGRDAAGKLAKKQKKDPSAISDIRISSDNKDNDASISGGKQKKEQKPKSSKDDQIKIDDIIYPPPPPPPEDTVKPEDDTFMGTSLDDVKNIAEPDADEDEPENAPSENKDTTTPQKASATTDAERAEIKGEIEGSIEKPKIEYVFPPIRLLKPAPRMSADKRREMHETAQKLMDVLQSFGVEATLLQVTQGPTVTRYEIQPDSGVKLSKITGLAEDIAMNLAVPTVLVAAVPGKAAVGIEVPNITVNTVSVRELLESSNFTEAKSKLTVAFGKDIGGNVVVGDIAKMPHVLIAGSTGSGKSVCINTIITSILYKAKPEEVKLIMIDPKVVELGVYNGIPHLLIPVVTDPKRAAGALNWAVGEMMRRYSLFAESATRNLSGYNAHITKNGGEALPQIVIIIDELADLMMVAAKEVEDYVCRLAQLARAAGIHLIIATQRPSVDVITGLIKANIPSRIAFAVSSAVDSRTILDKGGAEKLLGKGDMLYHPAGLSNSLRVQGAFVSDEEVENIVNFVKEHSGGDNYSDDISEHLDKVASGDVSSEESASDDDADALLPDAIRLAAELGQISTAMIQRRLSVGYARAGRIIDQMEMRGIISGANGSKPREVYLNRIDMSEYGG